MIAANPFAEVLTSAAEDLALVDRARAGDAQALDDLIRRHQAWIYNIVLRMVWYREDAEDATQEILVKAVTKLSTFKGKSKFRTWLYRIAVNHALNMRRGKGEAAQMTFEKFGAQLDGAPDLDLPDPKAVPVDIGLLVDDARIGCMTAMLLCLDRKQRIAYVLGGILGANSTVAGQILKIKPATFRQRLSRARRDLHAFMNEKCGLLNKANPCRCANKTSAFIEAGYVNPHSLAFARKRVTHVRDITPLALSGLGGNEQAYADLFRGHPFADGPNVDTLLGRVFSDPRVRSEFS